ncbi:MAG: cation diffusion facilitator family transporter [Acidobacteriota bacterium]
MSRYLHPCTELGNAFHNRPVKQTEDRRLRWVIALTAVMFIGELVGGIITNSLALLSDAGHMLTHLFSLAMSLLAIRISNRPANERRTFGYYRVEILAALFNGLTILIIVAYIFYGAVRQILAPEPIHIPPMLGIAALGLIVNLAGAWMLHGFAAHDINLRGAFVHLLTDTLSSVAIVAGGVIMMLTGWQWVDVLLSLVIGGVVLAWGIQLLHDSAHVLLESTPKSLSLREVCGAIKEVPGVRDVHDVHVWEITSHMYAMTGHLVVPDMSVRDTQAILDHVNQTVHERFRIGHTTFQFEIQAPAATARQG